jgi:glutathionylspermidine amidase/synthetase
MQDKGVEESYHTLYMKSLAEKAGIPCKIQEGLTGLSLIDGKIFDQEGVQIMTIWKTWAWETALEEIRKESLSPLKHETGVKLSEVLLNSEIRVFEPLWTAVTASKAILPVLWEMYPNHPYLLKSTYDLDQHLEDTGYARKAIGGRCGNNIRLFQNGDLIEATNGTFDEENAIYQEYFSLPEFEGWHPLVCCFAAGGKHAGTVLRVEKNLITNVHSQSWCLRVE